MSNFTCFADLEVSFSDRINVIIGENGLGKTHLLKVLYNTAQYKGNKSFTSKAPEGLLTKLTGEERVISIFKGDIEDRKYFNMDFLNSFGIEDNNQLKRSKQKYQG